MLISERYRVLHQLGSGGMSEVWKAEDITLGRNVAIKILRKPLSQDSNIHQRFLKEGEIIAKLSHPNIVPVFDQGILEDQRPYIVMEYIDGVTLKDREKRGLSESEIINIFTQILDAISAAHEAGIIHRDLKPDNIIVDQEDRVRIFDFGVARDLASLGSDTESGTIIGTAKYLSPEQAHGEPADQRSDLYAVGVMLYEALAGRPPWDAPTAISALVQQSSEPASPPSKWNPDVPDYLDNVALRSIAYRQDLRFQTASEFRQALHTEHNYRRPWRLLFLLAPALMIFAGWWYLSGDRTVPDLTGKSAAEARSILFEEDLQWISKRSVSDLPEGTVILTSPESGSKLRQGNTVILFVSSGPTFTQVPNDIIGKRAREALLELKSAGLQGRIRFSNSVNVAGTVLSSQPAPNARVRPGSTVILNVSRYKKQALPNCEGLLEEECLSLLGDFNVSSQTIPSSQPLGVVVRQSTTGQNQILLLISSGEETVIVPDVLYFDITEAQETLSQSSLGSIIQYRSVSDPGQFNRVLRQSPLPGISVRSGEVLLIVGRSLSDEKIATRQQPVAK